MAKDDTYRQTVREIRFSGIADAAAGERLRNDAGLRSALAARLSVDLLGCTDISGDFVLALLEQVRQRGPQGVSLRIRNNAVRETVEMCGLDRLTSIDLRD